MIDHYRHKTTNIRNGDDSSTGDDYWGVRMLIYNDSITKYENLSIKILKTYFFSSQKQCHKHYVTSHAPNLRFRSMRASFEVFVNRITNVNDLKNNLRSYDLNNIVTNGWSHCYVDSFHYKHTVCIWSWYDFIHRLKTIESLKTFTTVKQPQGR